MSLSPLFEGLDQFGMGDIQDVDLFEEQEEKKEIVRKKIPKVEIKPEELLYDRHLRCPVCENKFPSRTVKSGSARLEGTSITLRPIYSRIDMIIYDVVSCDCCGYTALNRNFNKITERQTQLVKENISSKFVATSYPKVYDYTIALKRYKLTLYNDVVIKRNDANKAYVCLKISWLLDSLIDEATEALVKEKLKKERDSFIENAYKGFEKAYSNISFPIFGMNEVTYHYLLGALAFEQRDKKSVSFWLSKVLISSSGSKRLKEKARELKGMMDQIR